MTFAPKSLLELQALWVGHGGEALGIVGDTAHIAKGTSYHLGADNLIAGAYSTVLARDKAGLSNAASAIDLGRLHGSYFYLRAFSRWLVQQVQDHPTTYHDVREVIYSPDGTHVYRWDNYARKLYLGGTGTGQGDDSHLTHTHISAFRDSEFRTKTGWIAPYFAAGSPVPAPGGTPDMPGVAFDLDVTHDTIPWDALGTARIKGTGHDLMRIRDQLPGASNVADGLDLKVVATGTIKAPPPPWAAVGERIVVYNYNGELHCSPWRDIAFTALAPPGDTTPFGQVQLDAAKAAGYADARTKAIGAVTAI